MGRYFYGDIEGKFWFAVQSSSAADRFGVAGSQPNYLTYYYTRDNLPDVIQELVNIKTSLGEYFDKFKKFFEEKSYYNDEELMEYLGLEDTDENKKKYRKMLEDYADHGLGIKIKKHLEEFHDCTFDAEF